MDERVVVGESAESSERQPQLLRAPQSRSAWGTSGIVIDAWRLLAIHARDCEDCEGPAVELRHIADQPAEVYERLCGEGRRLYEAWDEPKRELPPWAGPADRLLESIRGIRRMFDFEGLGEDAAEQRNRALARIPPGAFLHLKQLPHDERMAQVRALERAEHEPTPERAPRARSAAVSVEGAGRGERAATSASTADGERLCANEDCDRGPYSTRSRFRPAGDRQRFCTPSCRQTAHRRHLTPTEC